MGHYLSVQTIAVTVLGYPMSWIELIGTVFNLWCVWLVARNKILNWPVGIVGVIAFGIMFWQIQLYSDLFEQFYFLATSVWGWWLWLHPSQSGKVDKKGQRALAHIGAREAVFCGVGIALCTAVLARVTIMLPIWFPVVFPGSASLPYLDAATTAMSFAATILMVYRKVESWYLWIAVDIIGVPLYWVKDVHFVSLLYFVFLILATRGLFNWLSEYRQQQATSTGALP